VEIGDIFSANTTLYERRGPTIFPNKLMTYTTVKQVKVGAWVGKLQHNLTRQVPGQFRS
jgi:hypothetical protein